MVFGWLCWGWNPAGWLDSGIAYSFRKIIDYFNNGLAISGQVLDELGDAMNGFMAIHPMSSGITLPQGNLGNFVTITDSVMPEITMVAPEGGTKIAVVCGGERLI
jgi:hypothetical protein